MLLRHQTSTSVRHPPRPGSGHLGHRGQHLCGHQQAGPVPGVHEGLEGGSPSPCTHSALDAPRRFLCAITKQYVGDRRLRSAENRVQTGLVTRCPPPRTGPWLKGSSGTIQNSYTPAFVGAVEVLRFWLSLTDTEVERVGSHVIFGVDQAQKLPLDLRDNSDLSVQVTESRP